MRLLLLTIFILTGLTAFQPVIAGISNLVYYDENGHLAYDAYANRGQRDRVNILPDFSHAGYQGGGIPLPDVAPVLFLEPVAGDNHAQIQAAIDAVAEMPVNENGFRGAIVLEAGRYRVSESIRISASGIILRGVGQYPGESGGTELYATGTKQYDLVVFAGTASEERGPITAITDDLIGSGSDTFTVEAPSLFAIGDRIRITMTPNSDWIDLLGMAPYGWTPSGYNLTYERVVTAIEGGQITVHAPLVQPIEQRYGGAVVTTLNPTGRISHCGIENLWLRSAHTSQTDENHAWSAVRFQRTENCWARGVTAQYFGYACVVLDYAYYTTVQDCAMLDPVSLISGGRRYSFNINNGSFNLFQRCYANSGRHDAVTGSRVTGPNVFLDVLAENNLSNSGPHHRHATGNLFDRVVLTGSRGLDVENRQNSGTGHGWAGAQTVFWNSVAGSSVCDAPPGQMNFNIGFTGNQAEGNWAPAEPPGIWESQNDPIDAPHSLYLGQLEARLGPGAVAAIATEGQIAGDMPAFLQDWAGVGPLPATYDELCSTGGSFFGGCRSDLKQTFFGSIHDVGTQEWIYRYHDDTWYWICEGSTPGNMWLWSYSEQRHHWTAEAIFPWFMDVLNGSWRRYETPEVERMNVLENGDFANGSAGWDLYAGNGAAAMLSVVNGEAWIDITASSDTHHHIQLRQRGILLETGKAYTVAFKARAEAPRVVRAQLMLNVSPYTSYAWQNFSLTETLSAYAFSFTMENESDPDARFRFTFGGDSNNVVIDEVSLVEISGG